MAPVARSRTDQLEFLDEEAAHKLFDEIAQRHLGVSGQEFLRRWERGEYRHEQERPEVVFVAMLRSLAT